MPVPRVKRRLENLLRPLEVLRRFRDGKAYAIAALASTGVVTVHEFPFMAMSVGSVDGQWHLRAGDHRALPGDGRNDHVV